jgi:hypothetical protein
MQPTKRGRARAPLKDAAPRGDKDVSFLKSFAADLPVVRHTAIPGDHEMNEFRKRTWLLPALVAISAALAITLAVFAREAIICASLGDWEATRSYALGALIPMAGLIFFCWAYAAVRVQQIDRRGVTALTLRAGRVALPWSAIRRARFDRATALPEAGTTRARIGFAMYRDYGAAEAFARARLTEVGARVEG